MIERMGKRRRRRNHDAWWRQQYGGMPAWAIVASVAVIAVLGVVALSGLASNDAPATAGQSTPRPLPPISATREPAAAKVPIAVVGDSNTEVNSDDFAAGKIGDASWVRVLLSNGYSFAGGWADGGTTSATQAENLTPVTGADTLLIMTGTNDLGFGIGFDDTTANIDTMVEKVPAKRVVLLAVAPRDEETSPSSVEYNASLAALADARGWDFFDGMGFLRASDGGFAEATTGDGVHLNRDAQKQFGESVLAYLGR